MVPQNTSSVFEAALTPGRGAQSKVSTYCSPIVVPNVWYMPLFVIVFELMSRC